MKKLVSIVLSVLLVASLFVTYTSAVRINDDTNGFVGLQLTEGECELIDNSETNHLAFNKPVMLLGTHGIGTTSTGDIVKFSNVKIDKKATQVFIKGGYNLGEGYEGTAAKFSIYLNKVEGNPVASIEIFQEETASSKIINQIYKTADASIEPGTYTVYVVLESEYSGSISEVGFIYEGGKIDEQWKTSPGAVKATVEGKVEEVAPRIPYTYTGDNIYYISDNGNDANDGLTPETAIKSMTKATLLFGEVTDGTLVIVDVHTYSRSIPACNLVGADSYAKLQTNHDYRVDIAGDVVINNLIIHTQADWADLMARGHRLEIGENVKSTLDTSVTPRFMGIRGGDDKARIDGGTEVIIKGGEWETITMGGRDASTEGNVHLTLYDTAKISYLGLGNGVNNEEKPVNGSSTVKLMGKTVNLANPIKPRKDIMGNIYLDLTEYEGEKVAPAQWADVEDLIVLTNPELIPEDALPKSVIEAMEAEDDDSFFEDEMTEEEKKQAEEDAKAAEEAAKKAEEEKKAAEEAAKKAAEEEAAKKAAEEEAKKAAEEAAKAEEEAKKALDEATTEEEKAAAEEALKKAEEEKLAAEEAAKKAEEEAKAAEEAAKKAEEEKAAAEEAAKKAEEDKANAGKTEDKKDDEKADDDKTTDAPATENGGISPIIWVVIAVVVVAVIAVVVVASKKKKKA